MITLIPIEQISDAHGSLIVDAFNRFFILNGGEKDGYGDGDGGGYGNGRGVCPFEQVAEAPDGSGRKDRTQNC